MVGNREPGNKWSLSLLGRFELRDPAGELVVLKTKRSLLILAALAESREGRISRAELARLVWPDSDSKAARDSLRNELALLRHAVPGRFLHIEHDSVRLDQRSFEFDWLNSHGGSEEFMPGFDHEWADQVRLRLATRTGSEPIVNAGPAPDRALLSSWQWMVETNPIEALEMLASAPTQAINMPLLPAIDLHERALELNPRETASRRLVESQLIYLLVLSGRIRESVPRAKTVFDLARKNGEPLAAARTAISMAYGHLSKGDFVNSVRCARAALKSAEIARVPRFEVEYAMQCSVILDHSGQHRQAEAMLLRNRTRVEEFGTPQMIASFAINSFDFLTVAGKHDQALRCLQTARRIYEGCGAGRMASWLEFGQALHWEASGQLDAALESHRRIQQMNMADVGHAVLSLSQDRMASLNCRLGEFDTAARTFARSVLFRRRMGTVPSLSERRLIGKTRLELASKLGSRDLRHFFTQENSGQSPPRTV